MENLKRQFHFFFAVTMTLGSFANTVHAADRGGGSGKSYLYSAGVNVGYHPYAQTWVQGNKDEANYAYTGYSWLAYVTNLEPKKNGGTFTPPTFAIWGDVLTNKYSEEDPSGAKAKEVIKTQGVGFGLMAQESQTGISLALLLGVERAYLDQSGDSPRSQKYPYGFSSRVGLGWVPIQTALGVELRVDWVFKHFPSTKSGDDSLKTMQQQSFVPMLGLSYNQ